MGWEVAEGPEVEAEWFNFDALNLGADHPARQMQDTFFVDPPDAGLVLRTHTSPVQVRTMLERELPIYVALPRQGVPHRRARRHAHAGLPPGRGPRVDEGMTMAHLKGTLDHFVARAVRRGHDDPAAPVVLPVHRAERRDGLRCFVCRGADADCRTCGGTGWIEWGGCGMVNRKRAAPPAASTPTATPASPSAWASSAALMFRHGVQDMRDIVEGDVRFGAQFGMEI